MRHRLLWMRGIIPLILLCMLFACQPSGNEMDTLKELIDISKRGESIAESPIPNALPKGSDASIVEKYILRHPDFTSYHLLFLLKKVDRQAYDKMPAKIKAQVLSSALANSKFLNDWGILEPTQSGEAESGQSILVLDKAALPYLQKLLDDKRDVSLFGSEDATISRKYKYRRADFSYRYVMLILGRQPTFLVDPNERDKLIDALKKELESK